MEINVILKDYESIKNNKNTEDQNPFSLAMIEFVSIVTKLDRLQNFVERTSDSKT